MEVGRRDVGGRPMPWDESRRREAVGEMSESVWTQSLR